MKYTLKDAREALIGAFFTNLWWFALMEKPVPFLDNMIGLVISIVWFYVIYASFKKHNGEHFIVNLFVIYGFCVVMVLLFKLATLQEMLANPFGGFQMIAAWEALPVALLFDKFNTSSIFSRYYMGGP